MSTTAQPHVLFVDDDPDIVKAAALLARRQGIALTGAADPQAAWSLLADTRFDAILLDLNFARGHTSGAEGFRMLADLLAADPQAVVLVVTGHSGINIAVEAMRAGAADFIIKPWNNERFVASLQRALTLAAARRRMPQAADAGAPLLIGAHPDIVRVRDLVTRVAPTVAPVLVLGPAGAGKSLVARMLHRQSERSDLPLVTLAAHGELREAEIDAARAQAQGATLVIDAIEAAPRALQARLATGLEGIRVIATSRSDRTALRSALDSDLLYRVNTIEIALPPLAARGADKLLLARHFADRFARRHDRPARPFGDEAARAIELDDWPDDVRGLQQAIERAVLLAAGDSIGVDALGLASDAAAPLPRAAAADLNLDRSERTMIEAALHRHRFNVSRAADDLGLTRAALYRRMAKHGL